MAEPNATASTLASADDRGIRTPQILAALSFALDLTEGQPLGHALRTCVVAMSVGREMGLGEAELEDLYYAAIMKDLGCSANASKMFHLLGADDIRAKRDVKTTDWTRLGWDSLEYALTHVRTGAPFLSRVRALFEMARRKEQNGREMVQVRCARGANIARRIGLSGAVGEAIYSLDELWNGRGHPRGRKGEDIPRLSRILCLAQSVDVFYTARGAYAAEEMALRRRGRWFDPEAVRAFQSLAAGHGLWEQMDRAADRVAELEPAGARRAAGETRIENVCLAFAEVIDAKSPFTYRHSAGVAGAAVAIARTMGMDERDVTLLRRAGLLHDIGKLSVSNAILEKPGKLDTAEWETVKKHAYYSYEILRRVPRFEQLSEIAASHHEKLDGSGYFRGYRAEQLPLAARILVVADIYDALGARRPYRDAMPIEAVFAILDKEAPKALDARCVEALKHSHDDAQALTRDLLRLCSTVEDHQPAPAAAEPVDCIAR